VAWEMKVAECHCIGVDSKESERVLSRTSPSGMKLCRLEHTKVVHACMSLLRPRTTMAVRGAKMRVMGETALGGSMERG